MKDIKAVFDIWNDMIKGIVFAKDNEKNVVLVKQIETTKWMRKGKILDSEEFARTINNMVESFIKKLGGDFIDEVFVGISHPEMKVDRIKEQKRIMKPEIESEDVTHLSKVVAEISDQDNYETIKIIPVHRIVDEHKKEKDPIGLQWKKLELVADIFMLPKNFYNQIIETFEKVWLSIADIVPNIIAASEVALDYDHKDLWCILVDIGKNQTSYVIYEDGYPLDYGTINIWGEDVTKDISIWMQIDIKEAEQLKKTQASVIINKDDIDPNSPVDQLFLADIVNARYEEIFIKINQHLEKLDKDRRLPWGILLFGGGAKIANIDMLAKDIFKLALGTYIRSNKYTEWRKAHFKINLNFLSNIGKFFKDLF